MDQNLHITQAVRHVERILSYYPMVQQDGEATVWLTFEDWHVLYDLLFRTPDPRAHLPEAVKDFALADDAPVIVLRTEDCAVRVEMTS